MKIDRIETPIGTLTLAAEAGKLRELSFHGVSGSPPLIWALRRDTQLDEPNPLPQRFRVHLAVRSSPEGDALLTHRKRGVPIFGVITTTSADAVEEPGAPSSRPLLGAKVGSAKRPLSSESALLAIESDRLRLCALRLL